MARAPISTATGLANRMLYNPVGTTAGVIRKGAGIGRGVVQRSASAADRAGRAAVEVAPYAVSAASILGPLP